MNKKLAIIIPWVIIAILMAFLLWPDKHRDTHDSQYSEVVADHDTLQVHGVEYRRVIDSLSIRNYQLDSANKSLLKGQAITRKQLDLKTAEARDLAKEIQLRNKDTALQATIDSLVAQIENYAFLLTQYEVYSDSINKVNDSLKVNHDSKDKEKDKRITELQSAYDHLFKAYQQLFADSRGLMKDIKREKLKTKIVAVLAGAAAVLGLVK